VEKSTSGAAATAANSPFGLEKHAGIHHDTSEIQAPVYPIERKHQYPKDVPQRKDAPSKDDLKQPVLGVEGKHQFVDKAPPRHEQKLLQGPSYDVDRKHHFTKEDTSNVEAAKGLAGPAYDVKHGHNFPPDAATAIPQAPSPPKMTAGPVMDTEHKSQYAPSPQPR